MTTFYLPEGIFTPSPLQVKVGDYNTTYSLEQSANVMAYGAKGDGSDDTQAFLDACDAATTGTVYVPPGNYTIRNVIAPDYVRIVGAGRRLTTLTVSPAVGAIGVQLGEHGYLGHLKVSLTPGNQGTSQSLGTGDGSTTTFTTTLTSLPVMPGEVVIRDNGTQKAVDDGFGGVSGTGVTGTINYNTGAVSATFNTAPSSGHALTVSYNWQVIAVHMGTTLQTVDQDAIVLDCVDIIGSENQNIGVRNRVAQVSIIQNCEIYGFTHGIKIEQGASPNDQHLGNAMYISGCNIAQNWFGIQSAASVQVYGGSIQGNNYGYVDDWPGNPASVFTECQMYGVGFENNSVSPGLKYGRGGAINVLVTSHPASTVRFFGCTFAGADSASDLVTYAPAVYATNCKFQRGGTTAGSFTAPMYIRDPTYPSPAFPVWTATAGSITLLNSDGSAKQYVINSAGVANDMRLTGSVAATGASATVTVTFGTAQYDTNYKLAAFVPTTTSGTPATGSNRVLSVAKTTSGFTVTLEAAPGVGNTVNFDWVTQR